MTAYIQVITTTSSQADALEIARVLVERRLASCVQILGPITSVYRWEGRIEEAEEWQCWAKSRADLFPQIEAAIREIHSYQVPELLAFPVTAGGESYLAWLDDELGPRVS